MAMTRTPGWLPATPSPARRGRNIVRLAALTVGGALVLTALLLVILRVTHRGTLPRLTVAETEVGNLSASDLRVALEGYSRRRGAEPTVLRREASDISPEATVGATTEELGYALDVDETVRAALLRGRQANPITALADHLRSLFTPIEVEPVERIDQTRIDTFSARAVEELSLAPVEGTLQFSGAQVTRVDPVPGVAVVTDTLRDDVATAVATTGPDTLVVRTEQLTPMTTTADVDAVLAEANRALSGPVILRRGVGVLDLSPEEIGTILRVVPGDGGSGLDLRTDAGALLAAAGDVSVFESMPVDATVRLVGALPTVVEGAEGFTFDAERASSQLLAVATGTGPREAELDGVVVEPDRTTDEARALGITRKVSEFTTNYACCQSRVTNIQRIADIMDGVVVDPGETFSVNGFVGERTVENGFVGGGAIEDGEFIEAVGGGVSQFATTMFNAAYFGGYEIVEHKPHSQYISRYPEGREATLNFPNVDLKVRNSSPHGILVDTSHTDTSVTVAFYATPWVAVGSVTGPRSRFTDPETQVRETTELPLGVERVIQEGAGQGFDVTVTRTLRFPDGRTESEDFFTRYVARPRIVERGV